MRYRLLGLLAMSTALAACAPSEPEEINTREYDSTSRVEIGHTPDEPIGESKEFGGYACTEDCSGHEAGYQWAEENGIDDPDNCDGKSNSFIEGCITYVKEQIDDEADSDDEDSDDNSDD